MPTGPDMTRMGDSKKVQSVGGEEKIAYNIRNAVLTPKGSRPNLPEYGSRLHLLQFSLITQPMLDLIHYYIYEAIQNSVPNVNVEEVTYVVNHTRRSVKVGIKFSDQSEGLRGVANIEYANGKFG